MLIGPNDPIIVPPVARPVQDHLPDYEVELVIVIGKTVRDVPESQALDYVLGYTVGNDVSDISYPRIWFLTVPFKGVVPKASAGCHSMGLQ